MGAVPELSQWSFEVGSFLVLLGEEEEKNYRLMTRSLLECFAAAPVAGLQSYMRSHAQVFMHDVPAIHTYTSPYGCKAADLRNPRLQRTISVKELLRDGSFQVFRIPAGQGRKPGSPAILLSL